MNREREILNVAFVPFPVPDKLMVTESSLAKRGGEKLPTPAGLEPGSLLDLEQVDAVTLNNLAENFWRRLLAKAGIEWDDSPLGVQRLQIASLKIENARRGEELLAALRKLEPLRDLAGEAAGLKRELEALKEANRGKPDLRWKYERAVGRTEAVERRLKHARERLLKILMGEVKIVAGKEVRVTAKKLIRSPARAKRNGKAGRAVRH